MGTFKRFRFEIEVTFGEVGRKIPDPEELASSIDLLLADAGGLTIQVGVVDVEELG